MTMPPNVGPLTWDMALAVQRCITLLREPPRTQSEMADRIRGLADLLVDIEDRVCALEDHFGRPYSAEVVRLKPALTLIEGGRQ